MPFRGAALLVLLLASCAHSRARTDNAGPPVDAGASATPPAAAQRAEPPAQAPLPPTQPVRAEVQAATTPTPAESRVDFARDLQPIMASRCQPCHFPGGKMYDRYPFDRAATIRALGTKLFTRIKAEDEQALIRRFLAQP